MHELGILRQVVKTVEQAAWRNRIRKIEFITLEVGEDSGIVPQYLEKLFPVAIDGNPLLKDTELKIQVVDGTKMVIKNIGVFRYPAK